MGLTVLRNKITGKEVFSNAFPYKLVADTYYQIEGVYVSEGSGIDDRLIGGNKSEEATDEGTEETVATYPNVVKACELEESFVHIGEGKAGLKKYMKEVYEVMKENAKDREATKTAFTALTKNLLENYKALSFYASEGDGTVGEGSVVFMLNVAEGLMETAGSPVRFFVLNKDLEEEKC